MNVLLRDGYRTFFPWSAALGAALLGWWGAAWAGATPLPMDPKVHGAAMIYGVFGAAILGFILTAYPRQNEASPPSPAHILGMLLAHAACVVAILPFGAALPTGLRAVLAASPWALALVWAAPIAWTSLGRRWDGTTAGVPAGLLAGAAGAATFASGNLDLSLRLAIHGFAIFLLLVVLDRVLPFFSSRAVPNYAGRRLGGFAAALGSAAVLRIALPDLRILGDLALAALIARQWWGWAPWPASRVPMIGVIHLGILWILLGYAVDAAGVGPASLAAHCWLLGGVSTVWAGFTIRVTRGHGGLPIRMGWDGATILGLIQIAALVRVAAGLAGGSPLAYAIAALSAAAALLVWLGRVGPLVVRGA